MEYMQLISAQPTRYVDFVFSYLNLCVAVTTIIKILNFSGYDIAKSNLDFFSWDSLISSQKSQQEIDF